MQLQLLVEVWGNASSLLFNRISNFCKKHIIAMATTAYTRPWEIAFNKIGIEAIKNDPILKWKL